MFRVRHNVRLAALFMGGVSAVLCGCGQTPDATSGRDPARPPAPQGAAPSAESAEAHARLDPPSSSAAPPSTCTTRPSDGYVA